MNTLITWNQLREMEEATQNRFNRFLGGFPNRIGNGEPHSLGNFRRSFTLPEDADSKKVTAEFRDGVLKVHLPTTPIARSKAIEVKVA